MTGSDQRRKQLETAFADLYDSLLDTLYEEDPDGAGISAGSPRDEYDAEVMDLIRRLKGTRTRSDVEDILGEVFTSTTAATVDRVHAAWARFMLLTNPP